MPIKFNRSETFATNGTVTAAALHNLIDGTDIYQALITDQTNLTSVGSGDELLIADADLTAADAPRAVTVNELFEDALTISTYTNANINNISYGTSTGTRLVSTNASITTGTIPSLTAGTTTSTAASITSGTIPTLTAGTTTSTSANITNGTIQTLTASTATITNGTVSNLNSTTGTVGTLNSTTGTIGTLNSTAGTIGTLNSTTGTIGNLTTTLAGDFTISNGTGTIGSGVVTSTKLAAGIEVPAGSVLPFAMNSAPSGWLAADGSGVNRTTYSALFSSIGTTYGTGNGSTTFNIPDLRGYFVRGSGTNGDGSASGSFGAKQSAYAGSFTTQFTQDDGDAQTGSFRAVNDVYINGVLVANNGVGSLTTNTVTAGDTRPVNIAMLYCIKY